MESTDTDQSTRRRRLRAERALDIRCEVAALMAYIAALNILDAEPLLSTGKVRVRLDPAITSRKGIERHHLFPKAFLKREGVRSPTWR